MMTVTRTNKLIVDEFLLLRWEKLGFTLVSYDAVYAVVRLGPDFVAYGIETVRQFEYEMNAQFAFIASNPNTVVLRWNH